MRVAIVGAGRVGLVTGLVLWERGHTVAFVDRDPERVRAIRAGEAPFCEPGLAALCAQARANGGVEAACDAATIAPCDAALICVPTTPGEGGALATDTVAAAAQSGAVALAGRGALLVRSTVPPGTTRRLAALLPDEIAVGVVPEFLREGSALTDARAPDRLVVGAARPEPFAAVRLLFAAGPADDAPVIVETSPETAELTKLASNALLGLCVSFSNEVARIAERVPHADARAALDAVCLDRRLSVAGARAGLTAYLEPGPGFGGSCLGKDVAALASVGRALDRPSLLCEGLAAVNAAQPLHVVARLAAALDGLAGRRVLVLGLAFKPDTDDVRATVAEPIIAALERGGAAVLAHDPVAARAFFAARNGAAAAVADWRAALAGVDAAMVVTAWPEYAAGLASALADRARPIVLADLRGVLRGRRLPGAVRRLDVGVQGAWEARG